jgi:4-carboxymuconolactone decarboxylase
VQYATIRPPGRHRAITERPAPQRRLRWTIVTTEQPQPPALDLDLDPDGLAVRREVLGPDHVDAALARADDVTAEFQEMITRYAWGHIWTRPGLDRRMRSAITITALVAHGHYAELELHLRAALRNGLTRAEIVEVLLQTAIYCGVPAANSAFGVARRILNEDAS